MKTRHCWHHHLYCFTALICVVSLLLSGLPANAQVAGIQSPVAGIHPPVASPDEAGDLAEASDLQPETAPKPPYVNVQVDLTQEADALHLEAILTELERRGWRAAFYLTPQFAGDHAQTVKTLWARGHELGLLAEDDLLGLSVEEQTKRLGQALSAVRQAGDLPPEYPLHVRLQHYVVPYDQAMDTIKALESLGVPSLTGVFAVGDSFSCRYCAENERLMYPLPAAEAMSVTLIPVAVSAGTSDPLDDAYFQIAKRQAAGDNLFTVAMAKYNAFVPPAETLAQAEVQGEPGYVHDKYLTLILHPSITGADAQALANLAAFLDRVAEQSGGIVSNARIMEITAQVMAAGYLGSLQAVKDRELVCPNSQVTLTINWSATLYCPTYYFRIYGKYISESQWRPFHQASYYVTSGSYSFNKALIVPPPPTVSDTLYTFAVVGQSCASGRAGCGFPTMSSYEKKATTSVNVPSVKEIKVLPTTPETTKEVTLEAVLRGVSTAAQSAISAVTSKVDWTITPIGVRTEMTKGVAIPVVKGAVNPFKYTPSQNTHGEKKATAVVTFDQGGKTCQVQAEKDFKLFFVKKGDEDADTIPNWFEYWGPDNAVPQLRRTDVTFDSTAGAGSYGAFNPSNDKVELGGAAAQEHYPAKIDVPAVANKCPGGKFGGAKGIDCATEVMEHEVRHKWVYHNWDATGAWNGLLDSDDTTPADRRNLPSDSLPDSFEITSTHTLTNNVDSCDLATHKSPTYINYGDEEFYVMTYSNGKTGTAANDWANPGKQSNPAYLGLAIPQTLLSLPQSGPAAPAASYIITEPIMVPGMARLTGSYADTGVDTDADGLYNHLKLAVGVQVTVSELYNVVAWLESGTGAEIAWASTQGTLLAGANTVDLLFDGRVIRAAGLNGPYRVARVELRVSDRELLADAANNAHTTADYLAGNFDPYGAGFSGAYYDAGRDTTGDAKYDFLDIGVGLNVQTAGAYTVTGDLIGANNPEAGYLAGAQGGAVLSSGSQSITLSFDGSQLRQRRVSGPYALVNLDVYNAAGERVAFAPAPYTTTTAYPYTAFQPGLAELTGVYSDAGVDTNGNGKYDALRLSAGVNVLITGTYNLVGTLYDSRSAPIAWASQSYSLTTGVQTATLDFGGRDIGDHGVNGPYTITALSLLSVGGEMLSFEPGVYTTTAYAYTNFEASGAISGTVRSQAGQAISNTDIFIAGPTEAFTRSDANGQYLVGGLPVGSYTVYAIPPAAALLKEGSSGAYVYAGQTTVVNFSLPAAGGITGRVTDANGSPIAAQIDLGGYEPPHYVTDENGYYYITKLASGDYSLHITTDPAYTDWWMYVDGRHADNGHTVGAQVAEGRNTVVNFQRPPLVPVADLYVDKSLDQGTFGFDEEIVYRIRVRNLGNLAVSGIVVTDTLPVASIYVSETHPADFTTIITGSQVAWSKGYLPAYGQTGAEASLYLVVRLPGNLLAGDLVTNTLASSSSVSEGDYSNNAYAYARTAITPTRDLQVSKSLNSGTPVPGGDVQYSIYLYNSGNSAAPNVRITDTLPLSTTYVSQQNSTGFAAQVIGNQVVWTRPSFPVGQNTYLYLTVHISDALAGGEILTNTVRADTGRPETNYANNVYTQTVTVQPRTRDMYVSKTRYSGKYLAGAEVVYQVYVKNEGNTAAADVILTDTLPVSVTYLSSNNTTYFPSSAYNLFAPYVAGNVITWSLGTVPPGGYGSFYITTRISDAVAVGNALTNTAQVSTSHAESDYGDNAAAFPLTIIAPTCDMYLGKSLNNGTASPGSQMTYRVSYQNYGNSYCQNVVVTDTLPAAVDYVSWSGNVTPTVNGNLVTWNLGAVPGPYDTGYYGSLDLTVRLPETATVGTVLTNTATITTATPETNVNNNRATQVSTVSAPTPNLYVSKSLYSSQLVQGSESTYRIYYQNYNASAASDVVVTDTLPSGVSFVSASPFTPTIQGNQVIWNLGTVPGNGYNGYYGSLYLNVYVSETTAAGTVLTNSVVISTPYDTYLANNQAAYGSAVITGTRDLVLSKDLYSGYFVPGHEVTYRLYYGNQGNASARQVILTDTLPAGLTYVSHSGDFTPTVQGNQVVWNLGTVPAYGYGDYYGYLYLEARLSDSLTAGIVLTNTAVIATGQIESDYSNNSSAKAGTVVSPTRDLRVSKSLYDGGAMAGSVITYSVYVNNQGNAVAANVRLTDTLPLSTTYTGSYNQTYLPNYAYNAFTPTLQGNSVVWQLGDVPAGGYGYFYLGVRIQDSAPAGAILTNTAAVSTSDPDSNPYNNTYTYVQTVHVPDAYEPDNTFSQARPITTDGVSQHHNFHYGDSADWLRFGATLGQEYIIETGNLGSSTDTYVELYTSDGSTRLAYNDDGGGGYASRIVWVATQSDVYYIKVRNDWSYYGLNATYDLAVGEYTPAPDLQVTKTHAGLFSGGATITYTVCYTNQGTTTASNTVLTDRLPAATAYSWDSRGGTPDATGRVIVWNLGTLTPTAGGVIDILVHVSDTLQAGVRVTNSLEIATTDPERRYDNNTAAYGTVALAPWGGPDAFGYTFKPSNRPGGPIYQWVDIASTGTEVWPGLSKDDSYAGPFSIGFGFPFYGITQTNLYVSSNGYASFSASGSIPSSNLPDTGSPNNDIMPFGGDMYHTGGVSHIYYQQLGNPTRFVIQFNNLDNYGYRGHFATFQTILYPDGVILTQYKDAEMGYPPRVVGIENSSGTIGLNYGTAIFGGLAVRYSPPGVTPVAQRITLTAQPQSIPINGYTATVTAAVYDQSDSLMPDGTPVVLSTDRGSLGSSVVTKTTTGGVATAVLTSGSAAGLATVTARSGGVSATVQVEFVAVATGSIGPGGGVITSALGDVSITFPPGALSGITAISITNHFTATGFTGGYAFAGHAFGLTAGGVITLTVPITITVRYTDADLAAAGVSDETTLKMYRWTGAVWMELPVAARNTAENWFQVTTDHLSEFALAGRSHFRLYLPLVLRNF